MLLLPFAAIAVVAVAAVVAIANAAVAAVVAIAAAAAAGVGAASREAQRPATHPSARDTQTSASTRLLALTAPAPAS